MFEEPFTPTNSLDRAL